MAKRNIGSDFDDFLKEEGLLDEVTAVAVKRYIALQLAEKMTEERLSKAEMARYLLTRAGQAPPRRPRRVRRGRRKSGHRD